VGLYLAFLQPEQGGGLVNLCKAFMSPTVLIRCLPAMALCAFGMQQASAVTASGPIVYRGLTSGIDSNWFANTSGTSYSTWTTEGTLGFVRVSYSTQHDYGINYMLPDRDIESLYVKVWERQNGGTLHGPKNFKIFGQNHNGTESNTTFGLAGYGNTYNVYYGDSISGSNDATVEWTFLGVATGGTVFTRAQPTIVLTSTPPAIDNNWHEWGYYVKYNSDNVQDGELDILYDGKEVFHLTNVYNRANGAGAIDNFGIGQFYQPIGGNYPMTRDYRDVRVSYTGWPPSSDIAGNLLGGGTPTVTTPLPPSSVSVQ
jgi:hypothetical protein